APSWRRLIADIEEFLTAERLPDGALPLPTFLLGISWGGKTATALCARRPELVDGLVLVTPGLCPRVRPPFRQRLRIAPARLRAPGRLSPCPLDAPDLFTATPRWQQFIRDDPLSLRLATSRFLVESARLDAYLRWVPRRVQAPVLLLLA